MPLIKIQEYVLLYKLFEYLKNLYIYFIHSRHTRWIGGLLMPVRKVERPYYSITYYSIHPCYLKVKKIIPRYYIPKQIGNLDNEYNCNCVE